MIASIYDSFPLTHEKMLELVRQFGQQIAGGTLGLDSVQLKRLDTAAMALIVAINMKRLRSPNQAHEIKISPKSR